jgi:hypothetical protein
MPFDGRTANEGQSLLPRFQFLPLPEGSYFCSLPNTQRSISGATRVKAKTGSVHMHPRARVCATVTYRCNYKIVPLLKNSRGKFGDGDEAQSSPDIFLVQLGKRHRACIGGRGERQREAGPCGGARRSFAAGGFSSRARTRRESRSESVVRRARESRLVFDAVGAGESAGHGTSVKSARALPRARRDVARSADRA